MVSESEANQAGPSSRKCILVVDDDASLLKAMERALTAEGYTVIAESDPERALTHFRVFRIDLIVTDLEMPAMSGTALIERVREVSASTRALLMSGHAGAEALSPGITFLEKPFTPKRLLAAVRQALSGDPR